jgi:hypothetical protein
MHRHRLLGPIAFAAVITFVVAACGGTPTASPLTDPDAILKAAATTTATATSFHVDVTADGTLELDLTGTGSSAPLQLSNTTAAADVDIAGGDARATFSVPGLLGLAGEVIAIDGTGYVKTTLTGPLYQQQALGDVPTNVPSPDPSAIAAMVADIEEFLARPGVDPVKGEDVQCGTTTCYAVAIELTPEELAALGGESGAPLPSALPVPVPIDLGDTSLGLTIRVERDSTRLAGVTVVVGMGDAGELTAELTFSKWNEAVSIGAPPADQVAPAG